ncbi:hypothetical protein [Parasediminibacterium sp. JCM 36343]
MGSLLGGDNSEERKEDQQEASKFPSRGVPEGRGGYNPYCSII